ncbi:hypothetical protein D3C87_1746910 [compost metagenome]
MNMILSAVHLWPLNDNEPNTVSCTAKLISAFAVMMAAFLASRPKMARNLFTLGCSFLSSLATLLDPIKVRTLI